LTGPARPGVKPELQISPSVAQAIVNRVADNQTVEKVSELAGGEISAVYAIELTGAPPLVLKVYSEMMHWKMQKEALIYGWLEGKLDVPAPRILLVDDTKSLINLNFLVMNKLDGHVLGGFEPTLARTELLDAYNQMGRLFRQIHEIAMESFGYIGATGILPAYPGNRAYLSFQFEKKHREFAERGGDRRLGGRLERLIGERAHLLDTCTAARLCHYDFYTGNVVAQRRNGSLRLSGIFDFENAIAGDPMMDMAKTLYYLEHFSTGNEAKVAALLAGYGPLDRPHADETLALYRLYCMLELWCWFAQTADAEKLSELTTHLEAYE
jgi:aminoglycoside phosphotransferase (APT) family kinase protein